jgi:hypothetical protein
LTVSALRIYAQTSPLAGSYVYTDWPHAPYSNPSGRIKNES